MKNILLILALFIGNGFSETLEIYCKDFHSTNIIFDSDSMTVYSQHFGNLEYKIKDKFIYFERIFPEWLGMIDSFEFDNEKLILKQTNLRGSPRLGIPWEVSFQEIYQCKWVEFRK